METKSKIPLLSFDGPVKLTMFFIYMNNRAYDENN